MIQPGKFVIGRTKKNFAAMWADSNYQFCFAPTALSLQLGAACCVFGAKALVSLSPVPVRPLLFLLSNHTRNDHKEPLQGRKSPCRNSSDYSFS